MLWFHTVRNRCASPQRAGSVKLLCTGPGPTPWPNKKPARRRGLVVKRLAPSPKLAYNPTLGGRLRQRCNLVSSVLDYKEELNHLYQPLAKEFN
jgi:hypothetical protein